MEELIVNVAIHHEYLSLRLFPDSCDKIVIKN